MFDCQDESKRKRCPYCCNYSMGYQGRLGNFFWRFEKRSFLILESLKVRVGRNLKGHLTQPPIWCLNHLSRVLAKWSLLNYFMIFSRRLQNLLQWSLSFRSCPCSAGPAWFLAQSCDIPFAFLPSTSLIRLPFVCLSCFWEKCRDYQTPEHDM